MSARRFCAPLALANAATRLSPICLLRRDANALFSVAASKLKVLLSLEQPKMSDDDWMKTNRCRRCHGTGALPCKHCDGTGRLGPAQ